MTRHVTQSKLLLHICFAILVTPTSSLSLPGDTVLSVPRADLTTSNGTNESKDTTCNSVDHPNNDSARSTNCAADELMIVSKPGTCVKKVGKPYTGTVAAGESHFHVEVGDQCIIVTTDYNGQEV